MCIRTEDMQTVIAIEPGAYRIDLPAVGIRTHRVAINVDTMPREIGDRAISKGKTPVGDDAVATPVRLLVDSKGSTKVPCRFTS